MNWHDVFDKETIESINANRDNLDDLLTIINKLATDKYNLGYNNGYAAGNDVYCDDHATSTYDPLMDREYNI